MCIALEIKVVDTSTMEAFKHPLIWDTYILRPVDGGLVKALFKLQAIKGIQCVIERFLATVDKTKVLFRDHVSKWIQNYIEDEKDLLRAIPMFTTLEGSGNKKSHFVSIKTCSLANNEKLPIKCSEILLHLSDESSRATATGLGVRTTSVPRLLVDIYLPAVSSGYYDKRDLQILMIYICKNLKKFLHIDIQSAAQLIELVKNINFIARADGRLVRPVDLYDEGEVVVQKLFAGYDVFSCDDFAKPRYAESLRQFGLKNVESIASYDVLQLAQKISASDVNDNSECQRSEALIELLNKRILLLNHNMPGEGLLRDILLQLNWVKTIAIRPDQYPMGLAYAGENTKFTSPNRIMASKFSKLIGSVHPTVQIQGIANLAKTFGWDLVPKVQDIAQHVLNVADCYNSQQKLGTQSILHEVYRFLNDKSCLVGDFLSKVGNSSWIWNGDGIAQTSQTVMRACTVDLRPYFFSLPGDLWQFSKLWECCGLKMRGNLVDALLLIKTAHDSPTVGVKADVQHDLPLTVNILNEIIKDKDKQNYIDSVVIPIQDRNGLLQMKPISECVYCDKEWYQHGFDEKDLDVDYNLIHELIPLKTAKRLGVSSLVSRSIGAEELDIGYGQSESLKTRLNALLRDYNDGLAVLKELIQNADDAGAKEIHFVYDERQNSHARTILLDKDLQGPALWTYNDAVFTEKDFESIVKLSGASKEFITDKVGRFGLGFNVVYNLTDVPMFISSTAIAIFDPHTRHLGQLINSAKPGIRLNLKTHKQKIQRVSDQFKPFNGLFECDLTEQSTMTSFKGTLFRFPLRTPEQANCSDIIKKSYDKSEMMKLLLLLSQGGHQLLLFTQNVVKISVSHLANNAVPPTEIVFYRKKR